MLWKVKLQRRATTYNKILWYLGQKYHWDIWVVYVLLLISVG